MINEIIKKFNRFQYKYGLSDVFFDLIEMLAISLFNRNLSMTFDFQHNPVWIDNERRYELLRQKYLPEFENFAEIAALIMLEIINKDELLSELSSRINVLNKSQCQCFTPFHVSYMMATVTLSNVRYELLKQPFISICDPCCGAGVMLLAAAKVIREQGVDISKAAYFVGQDIDRRCAMMTFIQCEIKGIPATVICGNSLTCECREKWVTSAALKNYELFKKFI